MKTRTDFKLQPFPNEAELSEMENAVCRCLLYLFAVAVADCLEIALEAEELALEVEFAAAATIRKHKARQKIK